MKKSTITAAFQSDIQKVWDMVTNHENYAWRSDVSKIEVAPDGKTFVEYTKKGFPTTFTITEKTPLERYGFDLENKNMRGHWVGVFAKEGNGTRVTFTEEVAAKNPLMGFFLGGYLKKQQTAYMAGLKAALME